MKNTIEVRAVLEIATDGYPSADIVKKGVERVFNELQVKILEIHVQESDYRNLEDG